MQKPLHVRVAEALGWKLAVHPVLKPGDWWLAPAALVMSDDETDPDGAISIDAMPRYDTDWNVTGPLIALYGIDVMRVDEEGIWTASAGRTREHYQDGETPLVAICHLVLALSDACLLDQLRVNK